MQHREKTALNSDKKQPRQWTIFLSLRARRARINLIALQIYPYPWYRRRKIEPLYGQYGPPLSLFVRPSAVAPLQTSIHKFGEGTNMKRALRSALRGAASPVVVTGRRSAPRILDPSNLNSVSYLPPPSSSSLWRTKFWSDPLARRYFCSQRP